MLRYFNAWVVYPLAERWAGRDIRHKVAALRRDIALPAAERLARRKKQLAELLSRAGERVPYYRDLFRQHRFDPARLARDLRYLEEVPYLTKEIVREQGSRMLADNVKPAALHVRKTGGSTGASTFVYYSQEALDWTAAVHRLAVESTGRRSTMTEVHLASRYPEPFAWRERAKEHLKCMALNRRNIFTESFEPSELDRIWNELKRHRPYLVQGHPSTLYALALHVKAAQTQAPGVLTIFESTGEMLDDRKRQMIEEAFQCRTVNRYGNAEFGVLAYERDANRRQLEFFDWVGWPETVEVAESRQELVVTALLNEAMPLLRYRTGDLARLEQNDHGIVLSDLTGRVHDLVRIGNKAYPTHYLQDLLDRIGGIDEFQVEQRSGSRLLVRLVVPAADRHAEIASHLHAWWNDAVELEFTTLSGLKRQGWRGKFRYLVEGQAA